MGHSSLPSIRNSHSFVSVAAGTKPQDSSPYPDGDEGNTKVDEEPAKGDEVTEIHNGVSDVPALVQDCSDGLTRVRLWQDVGHVPAQGSREGIKAVLGMKELIYR